MIYGPLNCLFRIGSPIFLVAQVSESFGCVSYNTAIRTFQQHLHLGEQLLVMREKSFPGQIPGACEQLKTSNAPVKESIERIPERSLDIFSIMKFPKCHLCAQIASNTSRNDLRIQRDSAVAQLSVFPEFQRVPS